MKSYLILPNVKSRPLPEKFHGDDNRSSENLVQYFIENYTQKGDVVLDIFAGLGTTLFIAEEMDRIPFGIEYVKDRFEYIKENLKHKENIINGDSTKLLDYKIPECDICYSSPPFSHKESNYNPFTAYESEGNYQQYILDYQKIYSQVKQVMKPEAYVIVDIANLQNEKRKVTTLAWDVAKSISEILYFVKEVVIIRESRESETVDGRSEPWRIEGTFGYGYDHSYCLIFQNK
ncbi:MAG: site-specific DNA-methyltransferase [Asgard group archaeon]|nr:site-specific DNA-methyltransferase [Asgard group archaeon]